MNTFKQMLAVTTMNLRSLPQRLGSSLVIIVGIGGVVAVLVSVLAMSGGMVKAMQGAGQDDRAIVLRQGAAAEASSSLTNADALKIMDAPGIQLDENGDPIASA